MKRDAGKPGGEHILRTKAALAGAVLAAGLSVIGGAGAAVMAAEIPGPKGAVEIPLEVESETAPQLIGKREVTVAIPEAWEPERESGTPGAPRTEAQTETEAEAPEGYALTEWTEGKYMVFALDKEALPTDGTEPWMETVTVVFLEEDELAGALKAGEVDAACIDFSWDGELPAGYAVREAEEKEEEPAGPACQLIVCGGLETQGAVLTADPWSALERVADWYWK